MLGTELRFIMLGYGNCVCANRIVAVMRTNASPAKRMLKEAKRRENGVLDLTFGRATRSLILMDDQTIIECALKPKTVYERLNGNVNAGVVAGTEDDIADTEEEDDIIEDSGTEG